MQQLCNQNNANLFVALGSHVTDERGKAIPIIKVEYKQTTHRSVLTLGHTPSTTMEAIYRMCREQKSGIRLASGSYEYHSKSITVSSGQLSALNSIIAAEKLLESMSQCFIAEPTLTIAEQKVKEQCRMIEWKGCLVGIKPHYNKGKVKGSTMAFTTQSTKYAAYFMMQKSKVRKKVKKFIPSRCYLNR